MLEMRLHAHKINVVILGLSNSISWSVGFSILDEAIDVARTAPQGVHYHTDDTYVLPKLGIKKGAWGLWYLE